ncbi:2003117c-71d7-4dd3-919a-b02eb25c21c0 [Sclerotinia trifoliorum]|uniref:2003117c-71d7-4dd3-919a-b02eb25c21c0 n=1 Tax=Sclerotinia trifoliorum TaxID=28548 RepID=A0A8H2VZC2_9HELO|nr:2003117c-71d7-4dd3-919a-b02eb25c21c0 [Sclerotinia trifoliorum]
MSISPIITFKAGKCDLDTSSKPHKVKPDPTPGYIYLWAEDGLMHFQWRERSKPMDAEDNLDLIVPPADAIFQPYDSKQTDEATAKTNGRILVFKFLSSSQRYLFWMQSKPQARNGDPSWFSPRDLKIGQIVNTLLQGEEVNVEQEIAQVRGADGGDDDQDETMEDVEGHGNSSEHHGGSGGAGANATGGDVREEGASSREAGADGGRAAGSGPTDAASVVQNFLNSLKGSGGASMQQQSQGQMYTTLPDLLPNAVTIPSIDAATLAQVDNLLSYLPPTILQLAQESASSLELAEPTSQTAAAAIEALSLDQKKSVLKRVVRSPQFHQSLGSLTMAIRDGGLPSIADALGVKLENNGLVKGGSVPLGGGDAVEAFVEGVRKSVEKK